MKKQFELILTNRLKLFLLLLAGVPLLLVWIKPFDNLLAIFTFSKGLRMAGFFVVLFAVMYGLYRILKKFSGEKTMITISADAVIISSLNSAIEKQIPLSEITTYRHSTYNSDDILRLKMRDGTRTKLVVSGFFHSGQSEEFAKMVFALETALAHNSRIDGQPALREKTLFEKPISTLLLVLFAAMMIWMSWEQHTQHKRVSGSLISLWGFFSAYVAAWLVARNRRNEN